MTRQSIREYAEAIRERYRKGTKKEKGKILDEFTKVAGLHRKAAIRLLNRPKVSTGQKRRGRPRKYGVPVIEALKIMWEAEDHLCSKRLHPFLPELVKIMRQQGENEMTTAIEDQLCRMSPSTIDRVLRPYRQSGGRHVPSTTRPGSLLKSAIPIRTFGDWLENRPGFVEADLVAHCGESAEGFYLNTLVAVDVASGWTECIGVHGKGQERVGTAVHHLRQRFPFRLLGLDSDNGSEFINQHLYDYCRREGITFTRSRAYKKNDSCHVEQKNGNIVRRLIGYQRYSSKPALDALNRVYYPLRLYVNFFLPVMKLVSKTRHGAKVTKAYDTAQTPYQRLLNSDVLTKARKAELAITYSHLNPSTLRDQIKTGLKYLWTHEEPSAISHHGLNRE